VNSARERSVRNPGIASRKGGLVPDAAGGVLVHGCAGEGVEIENVARLDHHADKRVQLLGAQALEVDGHQKGRHLIVEYLVLQVRPEEHLDFLPGKLPPVALPFDGAGRDQAVRPVRTGASEPL
jgi:hypothetical protein